MSGKLIVPSMRDVLEATEAASVVRASALGLFETESMSRGLCTLHCAQQPCCVLWLCGRRPCGDWVQAFEHRDGGSKSACGVGRHARFLCGARGTVCMAAASMLHNDLSGGAGVVAAALRGGTAFVVSPLLADQFMWGRLVDTMEMGAFV